MYIQCALGVECDRALGVEYELSCICVSRV